MDMGSHSTVRAVFQNRLDFQLSFTIRNLHIPKSHIAKHEHFDTLKFPKLDQSTTRTHMHIP